jgi:hypothetical protein
MLPFRPAPGQHVGGPYGLERLGGDTELYRKHNYLGAKEPNETGTQRVRFPLALPPNILNPSSLVVQRLTVMTSHDILRGFLDCTHRGIIPLELIQNAAKSPARSAHDQRKLPTFTQLKSALLGVPACVSNLKSATTRAGSLTMTRTNPDGNYSQEQPRESAKRPWPSTPHLLKGEDS